MSTTPPRRISSTASDVSFLEALSQSAPSLPHSPRQDPSFFSPTTTTATDETRKSAETNGTGATGSTEVEGQATRSLVESVDARERIRHHTVDEEEAPTNATKGASSWIELNAVDARESAPANRDETAGEISLKFPEPFEPALSIKCEEDEQEEAAQRMESTFSREEESRLFDTTPVTNSQEAEGLERSVTRSQSDFTRWLEDTMRLARGDGTSSIETDDALSSILQATRETKFGCPVEDDALSSRSSILVTPIELEASLPFEAELSFERGQEDSHELETPIEGEEREVEAMIEEEDINPEANPDEIASSKEAEPTSRNLGWKLLSLSLAIALAYSVHRQRALSTLLKPTPSTRFVPIVRDNSTATFNAFATPVPIAHDMSVPFCALAVTLLAAIPTSVRLLRQGNRAERSAPQSLAPSPLLELNGDAVLSARESLSLGISQYTSRQLQRAVRTLTRILDMACAPLDKSMASESLGCCYYELARQSGDDASLLEDAKKAFERAIRLDSTRAGPRGGLGKTKYRLGDFGGAVKAFETAISRNEELWWAHEWLAKSLYRSGTTGGGRQVTIERHLMRAIELNPEGSYQARAFLGEVLHLDGQTQRALEVLKSSAALRIDQPQVHARLAFIANERLEPGLAAEHFRAVLRFRSYGGRIDETCPATLEAVRGINPYLSLYFVIPPHDKEARSRVLGSALSEFPHDELLQLLYAVAIAKSHAADDTVLEKRSIQLGKRSERFSDDAFVKGLHALSLLALGKQRQAEDVYTSFWTQIGGSSALATPTGPSTSAQTNHVRSQDRDVHEARRVADRDEKRRIAFLVMAFFEIRHASIPAQSKTVGESEATSPARTKARVPTATSPDKQRVVDGEKAQRPLRRSPRKVSASVPR